MNMETTHGGADAHGAEVVEALARALELHDYNRRGLFAETESHAWRVTRLAMQLAEHVAPELAADPRLEYGFRLHDIGMIGVSSEIYRKPGGLTRDELDEVREHPLLGERIVAPVSCLSGIARDR
jgi:HD-GYP domain-containing protein (c-di-GMP phosphodiesterase class II)